MGCLLVCVASDSSRRLWVVMLAWFHVLFLQWLKCQQTQFSTGDMLAAGRPGATIPESDNMLLVLAWDHIMAVCVCVVLLAVPVCVLRVLLLPYFCCCTPCL